MSPSAPRAVVLVAVALLVAACGVADTGRRQQGLAHADLDSGHLNVGLLAGGYGSCTATLIGRRTVLTAAHCISDPKTAPVFTLTAPSQVRYEGESAVIHEQFDINAPGLSDFDIAVVRLRERVSGVVPAELASTSPAVGLPVVLVGYGIPGDSGLPGAKRTGGTTISDVRTRTFLHRKRPVQPTTCSGDSGSPIFYVRDGVERVMGVHSAGTRPCEGGSGVGVHTRVDVHRAWIEKHAGADLYKGQPIDVDPPTVSIASPKADERPPPSFEVRVEADDGPGRVARVTLLLDGKEHGEKTSAPYTFALTLERRCYDIEAVAVDADGNRASAKRNVCVAAGAPFGAACGDGSDCESGVCAADACSQTCSSSEPCPDGFVCESNACVAPTEGGCQVAHAGSVSGIGATAPLAALALAVLGALGLRRRRRRQAGR